MLNNTTVFSFTGSHQSEEWALAKTARRDFTPNSKVRRATRDRRPAQAAALGASAAIMARWSALSATADDLLRVETCRNVNSAMQVFYTVQLLWPFMLFSFRIQWRTQWSWINPLNCSIRRFSSDCSRRLAWELQLAPCLLAHHFSLPGNYDVTKIRTIPRRSRVRAFDMQEDSWTTPTKANARRSFGAFQPMHPICFKRRILGKVFPALVWLEQKIAFWLGLKKTEKNNNYALEWFVLVSPGRKSCVSSSDFLSYNTLSNWRGKVVQHYYESSKKMLSD